MQRTWLFLLLVGCGSDAPSPDEVRLRLAKDLVSVGDAAELSRANGASLPDTTQFSLVASALGHLSSEIPTFGLEQDIPTMDDMMNSSGDDAARWLNENIFTDANHAGDGVYKIPARLACESEDGTLDADCVQAFDRLQLRIRVSEADDALRFALQIGPSHDEPIAVGLSAKLLSLTIDLDETEDAIRALAPKLGGDLPSFSLKGQATAALEVRGPAAVKLTLDIDRDIAVAFGDSFFTSQASRVASLTLDGGTKSMEASVGLGETRVHVVDEDGGETTDLDLPGISATLNYSDGYPLGISNISLGKRTTKLSQDGVSALEIDLNPDDNRKLDLNLDPSNGTLSAYPRLDLRTRVNHAALGDSAPVYDITRVALDGSLRARPESIQVLGTFAIETNPASYGIAATHGQCVFATETATHTALSVGACN